MIACFKMFNSHRIIHWAVLIDVFKLCKWHVARLIVLVLLFIQANVVLKEKETFIEYLQKQLNETKSKLDSEVSKMFVKIFFQTNLGISKWNDTIFNSPTF